MNWMSGKTRRYTCCQTWHCGYVCQYSMSAPIEYMGIMRIQTAVAEELAQLSVPSRRQRGHDGASLSRADIWSLAGPSDEESWSQEIKAVSLECGLYHALSDIYL